MLNKILRFFNNPTVKRILVWAGPIILGWIMKKVDTSAQKSSSKTKKK